MINICPLFVCGVKCIEDQQQVFGPVCKGRQHGGQGFVGFYIFIQIKKDKALCPKYSWSFWKATTSMRAPNVALTSLLSRSWSPKHSGDSMGQPISSTQCKSQLNQHQCHQRQGGEEETDDWPAYSLRSFLRGLWYA